MRRDVRAARAVAGAATGRDSPVGFENAKGLSLSRDWSASDLGTIDGVLGGNAARPHFVSIEHVVKSFNLDSRLESRRHLDSESSNRPSSSTRSRRPSATWPHRRVR